jgi:cell wall-associated NlpC family hydrolase
MKLCRFPAIGVGFAARTVPAHRGSLQRFVRSDRGEVRLPIVIAAGAGALFLMSLLAIPLFFGANQLFRGGSGECTDTSGAASQPRESGDANAIPSNYLGLYKKAGERFDLPWNLLAGIGKIETNHGQSRLPGVHSGENFAGAGGPMQFLAGTWNAFGVDGNGDGRKDRYDPADAIPGAARYLKHNGAPNRMRTAVFAYNHSVQYVNNVLSWANRYSDGAFNVIQANGPTCTDMNGAPAAPNAVVAQVIDFARAQLGKPYVFGAEGPDSFDCSGLTMRAYKTAGVSIPRTSDVQYWWGAEVPKGQEQQGDLVYFDFKPGHTGPGHVGIVYNPERHIMIVAPHTGDVVKLQSYRNFPGGIVGFTRPTAHNGHNGPRKRV